MAFREGTSTLTHRFGVPSRPQVFVAKRGGVFFSPWNMSRMILNQRWAKFGITPSPCVDARFWSFSFLGHSCHMGCCMDSTKNNNDDQNALWHSIIYIYISMYLSIYLSVCLSICPSVPAFIYLYVYPPMFLSLYRNCPLPVHLSTYLIYLVYPILSTPNISHPILSLSLSLSLSPSINESIFLSI